MILAGDIGGTKSLLACFTSESGPHQPLNERSLPSRDYPGLVEAVQDYLATTNEPVAAACFGIPGPISGDRIETPNLPWVVDVHKLRQLVGGELHLINDLEATGYGVATLKADELYTLSAGQPNPRSNAALIAPGTGLGEGILFWDGNRHRPSPSEGGHADFAPRDSFEMDFLRYLLREFDRVSFDRVVTGSGLRRCYDFLKETAYADEPAWLREEIARAEDPAAIISSAGMEGGSELAAKALDLWVSIFGAEAGNLALKALATAGVYLGGGIAPKILPKLKDGTFFTSFSHKGRLSSLVGRMPVQVILDAKTGLYGAARYALEMSGKQRLG